MVFDALNIALGLEVKMLDDGRCSCRYCVVSKKGKQIQVEDSAEISGTIAVILERLPRNIPVALSVSGKGIIQKNLKLTSESQIDQAFQATFPSVERAGFYVQQFGTETDALLSIVRKDMADDMLSKFKNAGFNVYILSLGAAVTAQIWPLLNFYSDDIHFDGHRFKVNKQKAFEHYEIDEIEREDFDLKIDQEVIPGKMLIAYASAFQLLLHDKIDLVYADADTLNTNFTNYLNNNKLKKQAAIFLFVLFGLLLISFVTFSYYNDQNVMLSAKVGEQTATADQTEQLNKRISEYERRLKALKWNGGYNYGFLINEIGKSLPRQLKLSGISINEAVKNQSGADWQPAIKVTGSTGDLTAVNNWIFVLKEKEWVKSVKLLKYTENEQGDNYIFSLEISY